MKGLRVAIVTRRFWPMVGGPERSLGRLAVELASRGCRITIVTIRWQPHWPSEIYCRGVSVVRVSPPPRGRWRTFQYHRALGQWLRRHADRFDVVYVSGLRQEAYAAMRALRGRTPVVLRAERSGRCGDCLRQLDAPCGRRIKSVCMKAGALVGPTPQIQRELEAAGYRRARIHYIPDGVALPPPRTAADKAAARAALNEANSMLQLADDMPLAVFVGRLDEGGQVEGLIAAWESVARQRPLARLWLAGEAADRTAIQGQIERLGLGGRVLMVGAFDEVDLLLAAADLLVAPSPEGSPAAILEAMSAGLPIVAADVAVNHFLVADGREALLVPRNDPAALAGAVERLLDDPELAARLGAAARGRAAEFPLAGMAERHLALFTDLLR